MGKYPVPMPTLLKLTSSKNFKVEQAQVIITEWQALELTEKQIIFLAHYVTNGFDKVAALQKAGFENKDKKLIAFAATKILQLPHVREAFNNWKNQFFNEIKDVLDIQIIEFLTRRAFYDPLTFFDIDHTCRPLDVIPPEWRICIDGIEKKYYGTDCIEVVSYTLADRSKAMDLLTKWTKIIETHTIDEEAKTIIQLQRQAEDKINEVFSKVESVNLLADK